MAEPVYSVIIPHYNIPDLLQRAIDSIPQREDIEVIIVDDNSNPSIVDFARFPGLDRPNTQCIFLKKNGGAGVARNKAISLAKGKWILCVDADDFLLDGAFEAIDKYRDSDSDVVVFKADSCLSEDITKKGKRYNAPQLCDYIDECIIGKREIRNLLFFIMGPICKLVKREFLQNNNIVFATTPCSEDVIWSSGIAVNYRSAEISTEYIYCITEREGSLTSAVDLRKLSIWCDVLKERNEYLRKHHFEEYYYYFTYDELLSLRKESVYAYIKICAKCLWYKILKPCTMYSIEAKLHLKYPYLFIFLGLLGFPRINKIPILYNLWRKML